MSYFPPAALRAAALLSLVAGAATAQQGEDAEAPARWWKGNTHVHTVLCGHADSTPEAVARWYHDRGWNFLVLSEHNRFIDPAEVKLPDPCRDDFLLVPGEEVTGKQDIHTTAFGIRELVGWGFDSSQKFEIVENHVDGIRAAGGEAILNHPNFVEALKPDELRPAKKLRFFELYNGHPSVGNFGTKNNPPTEVLWADLLDAGNRIYGLASDDAHVFQQWAPERSNPGRGWTMIRSKELSTDALLASLRAGDFYASSGVILAELTVSSESYHLRVDEAATARELESEILYGRVLPRGADDKTPATGWKIEFVGPGGEVLATHHELEARHPRPAELPYLRCRITHWRPADGERREEFYAWTQPAFAGE